MCLDYRKSKTEPSICVWDTIKSRQKGKPVIDYVAYLAESELDATYFEYGIFQRANLEKSKCNKSSFYKADFSNALFWEKK